MAAKPTASARLISTGPVARVAGGRLVFDVVRHHRVAPLLRKEARGVLVDPPEGVGPAVRSRKGQARRLHPSHLTEDAEPPGPPSRGRAPPAPPGSSRGPGSLFQARTCGGPRLRSRGWERSSVCWPPPVPSRGTRHRASSIPSAGFRFNGTPSKTSPLCPEGGASLSVENEAGRIPQRSPGRGGRRERPIRVLELKGLSVHSAESPRRIGDPAGQTRVSRQDCTVWHNCDSLLELPRQELIPATVERIGMRQVLTALTVIVLVLVASGADAQEKPNIVLVFMDNFGWGEPGFNGGGIIRGAPTPRLRQAGRRGSSTHELQRRGTMHAFPVCNHDRSLCHSEWQRGGLPSVAVCMAWFSGK